MSDADIGVARIIMSQMFVTPTGLLMRLEDQLTSLTEKWLDFLVAVGYQFRMSDFASSATHPDFKRVLKWARWNNIPNRMKSEPWESSDILECLVQDAMKTRNKFATDSEHKDEKDGKHGEIKEATSSDFAHLQSVLDLLYSRDSRELLYANPRNHWLQLDILFYSIVQKWHIAKRIVTFNCPLLEWWLDVGQTRYKSAFCDQAMANLYGHVARAFQASGHPLGNKLVACVKSRTSIVTGESARRIPCIPELDLESDPFFR